MRKIQFKPLQILCILFLGFSLTGMVMAQEGSETYGAYPGAPTQVPTQIPTPTPATTPAPIPGQPTIYAEYPAQPTTITTGPSTVTAIVFPQPPPSEQQNVLLAYSIQTAPPAAVYYSGSYLPWTSFYLVFPAKSPALWVSSFGGWSWYATCPIGGWVQQLIYVPENRPMKIYELSPDGTTTYSSLGWTAPGYKYRWFHATMPGRYITMVTVSDAPSNYITIDVA